MNECVSRLRFPVMLLLVLLLVGSSAPRGRAEVPVYREEPSGKFLRTWLLCGPLQLEAATGFDPDTQDQFEREGTHLPGFDTDFLAAHGGERSPRISVGQVETFNGGSATWVRHTADDFAVGTRMNALAEVQRAVVVYPEQPRSANVTRCWNWFRPRDQQRDGGETALLAGLTRHLVERHRLDAERVYLAGLSAGGAMAAVLAITHANLFAAVGIHSGLAGGAANDVRSAFAAMRAPGSGAPPFGPAGAATPPPLIVVHGDADGTVHPDNAERIVLQWRALSPALAQATATTEHGRVPGGRAWTRTTLTDPAGRRLLERWTVHGAGHAWSGGTEGGSYTDPAGPDASWAMLNFFATQRRFAGPALRRIAGAGFEMRLD